MKFQLGQVVATPGALEAMRLSGDTPQYYLDKHASGSWGIVPPEDAELNDRALVDGGRLMSSYDLRDGTVVWIITEADRSSTTILLPSEY